MSERLGQFETAPSEHEDSQNHETQSQSVEKEQVIKNETIDLEKSRERIKELHKPTSGSSRHVDEDDASKTRQLHPRIVSATENLSNSLSMIRRNLTPSQERFSKVIHNPIVSNISEATAKTLARPYAILTGGVVAFAGSVLYMFYSRHLGYRYNFFVPVLLFMTGLAVGTTVEILYKTLFHRRKQKN